MQHLQQLLERLILHEVEFVLVGGLAAWVHGSGLATRDLDVCCRFSEANLMRLQRSLEGLHPVHRMRPDLPLDLTPQQCIDLKNLYVKTDVGIIDCLGMVLGVGDYDDVFAHSDVIDLPVGPCRILDLETLIQAKEAMARPHDLLTAQQLRAVQSRKS